MRERERERESEREKEKERRGKERRGKRGRGGEGGKYERMVEKVLSNAVVPPSVLRNTIIFVTSLTPSILRVFRVGLSLVGRLDRIILRGIEPQGR